MSNRAQVVGHGGGGGTEGVGAGGIGAAGTGVARERGGTEGACGADGLLFPSHQEQGSGCGLWFDDTVDIARVGGECGDPGGR